MQVVDDDPTMAPFIFSTILNHDRLEDAVTARIADRLHSREISGRNHPPELRAQ